MPDTFDEKLCDERHKKIDQDMTTLFKKLDLYTLIIAILTLMTLVMGIIEKKKQNGAGKYGPQELHGNGIHRLGNSWC